MLQLRNGIATDNVSASEDDGGSTDTGEDCIEDVEIDGASDGLGTSSYVIGDLQIMSLGNSLWFEAATYKLRCFIKLLVSCVLSNFSHHIWDWLSLRI